MKLIAGLGNPGREYARSRHNIGYCVADELARRWSISLDRHNPRFDALAGDGPIAGARTLLLKPTTYMNLSGRSVAAALNFYKLDPLADLLVVLDDLDLPIGRVRLRATGSAGGHHGLEDIIRHIGTDALARLRVGIGRVHKDATVAHVLGAFAPDERDLIADAITRAADAAECWLREGLTAAMDKYNRRNESDDCSEPPRPGPATQGDQR